MCDNRNKVKEPMSFLMILSKFGEQGIDILIAHTNLIVFCVSQIVRVVSTTMDIVQMIPLMRLSLRCTLPQKCISLFMFTHNDRLQRFCWHFFLFQFGSAWDEFLHIKRTKMRQYASLHIHARVLFNKMNEN